MHDRKESIWMDAENRFDIEKRTGTDIQGMDDIDYRRKDKDRY